MDVRLAHIVNAVAPEDNPSLEKIQSVTFRSMIEAAHWKGNPPVELMSAQYSNARSMLPVGFTPTTDLVSCSAEKNELGTKKRLPLISEILSRLKESKDATHFILTNADIAVMPFFYSAVAQCIRLGYDALVINRRRIRKTFENDGNLDLMYAEAGKKHAGFDCFVFERKLLDQFIASEIYISTPPAGTDIFHNVFTFAENPVLFTGKHLTFHIGMELVRNWGEPRLNRHNQEQFSSLLRKLKPHMKVAKFPGAGEGFFKRHFKWLMNPAFHYPTMASLDFRQWGEPRKKPRLQEDRNRYYEWLFDKTGFRENE